MTRSRSIILVIAAFSFGAVSTGTYAERREHNERVEQATHNVKATPRMDRSAGYLRQHVDREPARSIAGGLPLKLYHAFLNRRIERTRDRIITSLATNPDDVDARDHLWQRLHRLQHRRGNA